jgi:dipeptidase E
MRLILSSWYLRPGQRPPLLRRDGRRGRVGIVLNALDQFGATRDRDLPREIYTLERFGYVGEELDLRDYFEDRFRLRVRLRDFDLVWVLGGNSFVLARAMTQSGFVDAVRHRLDDETFAYGGYSAGSCVAGPDLQGIDLVDDPSVVPEGYSPEIEPRCLDLVPFRIVPHWRSDHPESERVELAAEYLAAEGLSHRCLRDGQALAVDGDIVTLHELGRSS